MTAAAPRPSRLALFALALACPLLLATARPAAAIQVEQTAFALMLTDPVAAANTIVVAHSGPSAVRVTDSAGVTIGPQDTRCVAETPQSALCTSLTSGPLTNALKAELGPGDDSITLPDVSISLVTLEGGEGNDLLVGTGLDNIIRGGPGADRLDGAAGPDNIVGGPGDDDCIGGSGKDLCTAGDGNDTCEMGAGKDDCWLSDGRDVCEMGAGADNCRGGKGRDRCDGGPGKDISFNCERTRRFEDNL